MCCHVFCDAGSLAGSIKGRLASEKGFSQTEVVVFFLKKILNVFEAVITTVECRGAGRLGVGRKRGEYPRGIYKKWAVSKKKKTGIER